MHSPLVVLALVAYIVSCAMLGRVGGSALSTVVARAARFTAARVRSGSG